MIGYFDIDGIFILLRVLPKGDCNLCSYEKFERPIISPNSINCL